MTVALGGKAPATFEIKSATLPLVALLLKSPDLARLGEELHGRFGDMPDFFEHDPLLIDLAPLQAQFSASSIDFSELLALLKGYRVVPIAVRGGSEQQMLAARRAGLAVGSEATMVRGAGSAINEQTDAPPGAPTPALPQREREEDTTLLAEDPPPPLQRLSALVIDRPLRSGQQVYARGRDLVVLSMVNPGAEVIADGHIHVYAPLRGKAIAGARGDTDARILTLCLEPELVSIAGVYRTTDVPLPASVLGKPAQIRLQGEGKLVMEPLG